MNGAWKLAGADESSPAWTAWVYVVNTPVPYNLPRVALTSGSRPSPQEIQRKGQEQREQRCTKGRAWTPPVMTKTVVAGELFPATSANSFPREVALS